MSSLASRNALPQWSVDEHLTSLIPDEPTHLREKHRLVYKGTIAYFQVAPACLALANGSSPITLVGTSNSGATETVEVLGATAACSHGVETLVATGATQAPADFQIMLKKRNMPLANSFTVLWCGAGATSCMTYRLSHPCFRGRCTVDADKTLNSGLFSTDPLPLGLKTVSHSKTVFGTWADRIRANHTASVTNAFQHWQLYWGWQYDTPKALATAFQNWQQSVLKVHAALSQLGNATGPNAYLPGLTKMSDLSYTDFLKYSMGLRHGTAKPRSRNGTAVEISPAARRRLLASTPAAIDWSALDKVTPTRDQGQCGSCYSFSGTAAIESRLLIQKGLRASKTPQLALSRQESVSCSTMGSGCDSGGFPWEVATSPGLIHPIVPESVYPYTSGKTGTDGKCKLFTTTPPNSVMTTGVIDQMNDNGPLTKEQIMSYVAQGPIVVSIFGGVLNSYNGGVIPAKACTSTKTDHAVLLVGYDRNQKWWKIQNSWGPDWGESGGYFRLAMTDGAGACGINSQAAWPTGAVWATEQLPVEAALLNQVVVIAAPRVGANACLRRCASTDTGCRKLPSGYSVPGAIPVVLSNDCNNVAASSKRWKPIQILRNLWQFASEDGKLCLTAATADTVLDTYLFDRMVAAPCASLGPTSPEANPQLFYASPDSAHTNLNGRPGYSIVTNLITKDKTFPYVACISTDCSPSTAGCNKYAPAGSQDAVLGICSTTYSTTDATSADPSETFTFIKQTPSTNPSPSPTPKPSPSPSPVPSSKKSPPPSKGPGRSSPPPPLPLLPPPSTCDPLDTQCAYDDDCCSGHCIEDSSQNSYCHKCLKQGESCYYSVDCCSSSCVSYSTNNPYYCA